MSETTTAAPAAAEAAAPAAPATPAAPAPAAPATPAAPAATEWDGKVESLPEPVQKMIRDLRGENADKRTKLTTAEQAQQKAIRALAAAAGIELPGGEEAADPAALASQLTASQQATQTLQREHQVLLSAITAGADHGALLDSRSFLEKVAALDPSAEGFAAEVDAAVKAATEANPKFRKAQAAGASGVDHAGGSGEGAVTPEQFKSMTGAQRNTLARTNPSLYNQLSGRS